MPPTPCPKRPGCRCPHCYGLREHMLELTGRTHGLPVTRPTHILHAVTSLHAVCDGSMTCPCRECVAERANRKPFGSGRQPWHAISRQRRAA